MVAATSSSPQSGTRIYRHSLLTRTTHWINVVCMTVLLMSGLQIFNAHPALYLGKASDFDHPIAAIGAEQTSDGKLRGVASIGGIELNTTGFLGASTGTDGGIEARGFPAWATLPSDEWLSLGRRWHFFFAWLFVINGMVYATATILSGRLRRELIPSPHELKHIPASIAEHLRLRFPKGDEARHYNVLQKLAYLIVAFAIGPLILLAGMTMSPGFDAGMPWLVDLFGGRQTARTIHFVCAFAFLGFVFIHLVMVLVSGVWNNLRSMITGWYDIGVSHDR
jgi:thiosulfate reductase cytochrome b subunit